MKKLKELKNKFRFEVEKLTDRDLNFISGGARGGAGSSGSGSGTSANGDPITGADCCCDATVVHCCPPVLKPDPSKPSTGE